MRYIKRDLIKKIKEDTGIEIPENSNFKRPTLTWAHKSVGRLSWYFYTKSGECIGSCETMSALLKCEKIQFSKFNRTDIELSPD